MLTKEKATEMLCTVGADEAEIITYQSLANEFTQASEKLGVPFEELISRVLLLLHDEP